MARSKLLFVDDEAAIRVTLPLILEREGFAVTAKARERIEIRAILH